MSPSANVLSIQAIEDLKTALSHFGNEAQEVLSAAELEIHRTLDWLQERLNHWLNEVQRRQEQVRLAQAALARCEASGYYDQDGHYYPPNCSAYQQALHQAQVRLQEAQAELANVRRWLTQIQHAIGAYRAQTRRLQDLTTTHTEKAQAFLGRKVDELEQYAALASGTAIFGPILLRAVKGHYDAWRAKVGADARNCARQQEMELVRKTGWGTRDWMGSELELLRADSFPKGYDAHHINNVVRFPDLADNPDNIMFVTRKEHFRLHHQSWHNNTSSKMFNRKSLMAQWPRYK